jgi:DNA repair exonuclease SbcCD ATPase subunit
MEENASGNAQPSRATKLRARLEAVEDEIRAAERRLEDIEQERSSLEQNLVRLNAQLEVLGPICDDAEQDESNEWAELAKCGIQECCYRVLVETGEPQSAKDIRFELEQRGVDVSRYANGLAVIHTSLGRIPDRVKSFRRKEYIGEDRSKKVWIRYYKAIPQDSPEPEGTFKQ